MSHFCLRAATGVVMGLSGSAAMADLTADQVWQGWTGYMAVKSAWKGIPVDCSDVVDDELYRGEL